MKLANDDPLARHPGFRHATGRTEFKAEGGVVSASLVGLINLRGTGLDDDLLAQLRSRTDVFGVVKYKSKAVLGGGVDLQKPKGEIEIYAVSGDAARRFANRYL